MVSVSLSWQVIKFGLKHVTTLIEEQKASLVVIAHDVSPIELVVWLPALCRKMGVPYCILKGKVRLGCAASWYSNCQRLVPPSSVFCGVSSPWCVVISFFYGAGFGQPPTSSLYAILNTAQTWFCFLSCVPPPPFPPDHHVAFYLSMVFCCLVCLLLERLTYV